MRVGQAPDTDRPVGGGPAPQDGPGRLRTAVCWGAAAATLPYLALKGLWLAGSDVGIVDAATLDNGTYRAANAVTVVLDAFVVLLALALTYRFGRRLPAWLLVAPMWVATGLLGPIAALLPATVTLASDRARGASQDALADWVYVLVYTGFTVQGLLIGAAFALYAARRWPGVLHGRLGAAGASPLAPVHRFLAGGLAVLAAVVAALNLAYALGMRAGLGELADRQTGVDRLTLAVYAAFGLLVVVGLPALVTRRPAGWPAWLPLAMTWLGSGAMTAWGLYFLVISTRDQSLTGPGLTRLVAVKLMGGAATAVLGSLVAPARRLGDHQDR